MSELSPEQISGLEGIVSGEPGIEHLTDLGNARRFVRQHGKRVRYCHPQRHWYVWNGILWATDNTGEIDRLAAQTVASIYAEAADAATADDRRKIGDHARRSESENRLRAMVRRAQSEAGVPVLPGELDSGLFLLACPNGTLDLRTGELREHRSLDLITQGTAVSYDPVAECPRWKQFLAEVFDGDDELISFVKRMVGYSLTGDTREDALFVLHGTGWNGKSTFFEVTQKLVGDLTATAAFDTFVRTRRDRGPRDDLARLHGARLVIASESGEGRRLDEATVKSLTGGDRVTARFLYGEYFEFVPQFKLWLVTNHRPRVDGDDDAIWRRLRLVPFEQNFEGGDDKELDRKLKAELEGILAWAVEGCLEWLRDGLGMAGAVARATCEYRAEEDVLGAFLSERCELDGTTRVAELRAAYESFCDEVGEKPLGASALGQRLAKRGIRSERGAKGRRTYLGVSLRVTG